MNDTLWGLVATALVHQTDAIARSAGGAPGGVVLRPGLPVEPLGQGEPEVALAQALERTPSGTWVVAICGETERSGKRIKVVSLTAFDGSGHHQFVMPYTVDPLTFAPLLGTRGPEDQDALCAALEATGPSDRLRELVTACRAPVAPDTPLTAWTPAELERYPDLDSALLHGYAAVAIAVSQADGTPSEVELAAGVKFLLSRGGPAAALLAPGHQPLVRVIYDVVNQGLDPFALLAKSLEWLTRQVHPTLHASYVEDLRGIGMAVASAEGAGFFSRLVGRSPVSADEERALAKLEQIYEALLASRPVAAGDDPASRRTRTNADLTARGLRLPSQGLPLVRDEGLRDASEVAVRAQSLTVAVMMSGMFSVTGRVASEAELREQFGPLFDALTADERAFLRAPDAEVARQLAWRTEALVALVWALGWRDTLLPFDAKDESGQVLPASRFTSEAVRQATLRPAYEILDQLDAVYCRRWIIVDAQQRGAPLPPGLLPPLLLERHHALLWLNGRVEWDEVRCST
jgi:hypothetical protein